MFNPSFHRLPRLAATPLIAALLLALGWPLAHFTPAKAAPLATLYVNANSGNDGNNCLAPASACATITAAVAKANDGDTIQIAAGAYFENNIQISQRLTLIGADPATTIVDGGQNGRIFDLYGGATLANLTLQNGKTPEDDNIYNSGGGAIRVGSSDPARLQNMVLRYNEASGSGGAIFLSGNLIIDHSVIQGNRANQVGGALYHYGILASSGVTITHSLIAENVAVGAFGGGISATRRVVVQESTIRDNEAAAYGGGLHISAFGSAFAAATVDNSTIQGNRSSIGAGVFVEALSSAITMTNVTVSNNVASNNQAGIYLSGGETVLTLRNSTVTQNSRTNAGGIGRNGLIVTDGARATLVNSIIADNQGENCLVAGNSLLTSLGHNLSSDNSCNLGQATDLPATEPLLMPLGDYGGATPTHALRPGSPAIDAGGNANCPATDQRGVARPYDGDNNGSATCDIGAVEAQHQLTIADVSVLEGTGGARSAVFTVTLTPASSQNVTVNYTTVNGTANAPGDYTAASGSLTFAPGQTTRTLAAPIVTDGDNEPDETFQVLLSSPTNAVILIGAATGTILNEDGLPALSISDASGMEGNGGATPLIFDVALSVASDQTITVGYATQNGTATASADYTAASGVLTFLPGQTSKQITVQVQGDRTDEGVSEQFQLLLSSPSNAVIAKSSGAGVITDDDSAQLALQSGPNVVEGNSGFTPAVFTVTLSTPAAYGVTVGYTVFPGFSTTGATAGVDFVGVFTGTLTIQPGQMAVTFSVNVVGDTEPEPDEEFRADISNANAPIFGTTAFATILNDDGEVPNDLDHKLHLPIVSR